MAAFPCSDFHSQPSKGGIYEKINHGLSALRATWRDANPAPLVVHAAIRATWHDWRRRLSQRVAAWARKDAA
jgi:hypothetical protein